MRLTHSLFLALLVSAISVVGVVLVVMQGYTNRSFSDYLASQDRARADEIVATLTGHYDTQQGWRAVLENPGQWPDLFPGQAGDDFSRPTGHRPPPPLHGERFPPPHRGRHHSPAPPRLEDGRRNPKPLPMFILFNANKTALSYTKVRQAERWKLQPISLNGQTIGWLGHAIRNKETHPLDEAFAQRQRLGFGLAAVGGLLLSGCFAIFFAWRLSQPIKRLSKGTRALADGDFSIRLPEEGQRELAELAKDFNQLAESLSDSETRQLQWLADVAHELRTPLAVLRGEIEALQDGIRPLERTALDSLHQEVMHLASLINDLHTLSMAEAGDLKLHWQTADLLSLVRGQVERFAGQMADRGLRLETFYPDRSSVVRLDVQRIQQVLDNLLENVLRYAVPGPVQITVTREGKNMRISVEDSGPGVPEHSLARLFDRLYRTDAARNRHQGGTGLGMAICRSIVEGHHGKITAMNNSRGGLSIHVLLPMQAVPT